VLQKEITNIEAEIRNVLSDKTLESTSFDDLCNSLGLLLYIADASHFNIETSLMPLKDLFPFPSSYFTFYPTQAVSNLENISVNLCELANEKMTFKLETIRDFINLYVKAKTENPEETMTLIKSWEEFMNLTPTGKFLHNWIWIYPKSYMKRDRITWREYIENLVTARSDPGKKISD